MGGGTLFGLRAQGLASLLLLVLALFSDPHFLWVDIGGQSLWLRACCDGILEPPIIEALVQHVVVIEHT
jgi:hypothetical protein